MTNLIVSISARLQRLLVRPSPFPKPLREWVESSGPLTLLDIGANRGDFTSDLARFHCVERAWLIEPQRRLADKLRQRFSGPNFSIYQLALADRAGSIDLESNSNLDAIASVLPIKAEMPELRHLPIGVREVEVVPVDTLDQFAAIAGIRWLDLMKVDTQGNELQVFHGGLEILRRTRAVWVELSFKQLYNGACLIHEVVDFLHRQGLYLRDLSPEFRGPSGELLQVNGLFTRAPIN